MTKRASLAALLGTGALGVTAGGLAGYYGSDKANNTPSTVLGALGGGAGATAGLLGGIHSLDGLSIDLNNTMVRSKWLSDLDDYVRSVTEDPKKIVSKIGHEELLKNKAALEKQLAKTPKWMKYIAKHPKLHNALMLGTLGLGTAAGGALGAELGIIGGDALA